MATSSFYFFFLDQKKFHLDDLHGSQSYWHCKDIPHGTYLTENSVGEALMVMEIRQMSFEYVAMLDRANILTDLPIAV